MPCTVWSKQLIPGAMLRHVISAGRSASCAAGAVCMVLCAEVLVQAASKQAASMHAAEMLAAKTLAANICAKKARGACKKKNPQ